MPATVVSVDIRAIGCSRLRVKLRPRGTPLAQLACSFQPGSSMNFVEIEEFLLAVVPEAFALPVLKVTGQLPAAVRSSGDV